MFKLLSLALLASLALGCASRSNSRNPSQDFNVTLKDSNGKTQAATSTPGSTDGLQRSGVAPSDEESRRQAEAMKVAVANAVNKAEANHERVTGEHAAKPLTIPPTANTGAAATVDSASATPAPTEAPKETTQQAVSTPATRVVGPVNSEQALKWLKNGNRRFAKGFLRNDGASAKDRARVAKLQTPHAVVITSSDSRVPPELIFDQKLGEIFVLRLVDGEMDAQVQKSLREGVGRLGANLVVILGVNSLRNWENPRGMAHSWTESSEILRGAVASGSVKVVPALYNLNTGSVTWAE